MWLKVPTSEKNERKFFVDEASNDSKAPVRIVTYLGVELRLTWQEADDLCKELNFLLMDRNYRGIEK